MDKFNFVSMAGMAGMMLVAWALSTNRKIINWRCIAGGLVILMVTGLLVFGMDKSGDTFQRINEAVLGVLGASKAGQQFVFGKLGIDPGKIGAGSEAGSPYFVLALQWLGLVIFFSTAMSLLYFLGIMRYVVKAFSWFFTRFMRVSGSESLCAAGSMLMGVGSITAIRPQLAGLTRSELCTILTVGMAAVASSTMANQVAFLQAAFPTIAGHMIAASIMSIPAAMIMSKLMVPEDGQPATMGGWNTKVDYQPDSSGLEAIVSGSMAGAKVVVGVVAVLIGLLGIIGLVDAALGYGAGLFNRTLSLERMASYLFWPFAVMMGMPPHDATTGGQLLGERLIGPGVPAHAYKSLAAAIADGKFDNPRSGVVMAYALCGFASAASLATFVGGLSALVPQRQKDIVAVSLRALVAASLACLLTGAVAGMFYNRSMALISLGQ